MTSWPQYKNNTSMVYYAGADIPYQFALANAFTLCDAYHSSFTGGTNPNRCYLFTGNNHGHDDPSNPAVFNGPAVDNSYNALTNGAICRYRVSGQAHGHPAPSSFFHIHFRPSSCRQTLTRCVMPSPAMSGRHMWLLCAYPCSSITELPR